VSNLVTMLSFRCRIASLGPREKSTGSTLLYIAKGPAVEGAGPFNSAAGRGHRRKAYVEKTSRRGASLLLIGDKSGCRQRACSGITDNKERAIQSLALTYKRN
jgi:hypothetical protein